MIAPAWEPTTSRIMPELLDQARAWLDEKLTPAGEQGVGVALKPLMLSTQVPATEGMSDKTVIAYYAAMGSEYERLLADIPLDLLKMAADKCAKESEFFPMVARLRKHAEAELDKRKRQSERLAILVDHQAKAKSKSAKPEPPPFVPEPLEHRLRARIWMGWKYRDTFIGAQRWQSGCEAERELATIEGRDPAAWAIAEPAKLPIAPRTPPTAKPLPLAPAEKVERAMLDEEPSSSLDALAELPPISQGEQPPLPDEIPE